MARFRSLVLLLAIAVPFGCRQKTAETFPNAPVILISIDTLRADHLKLYGAKLPDTPAIDRLASDGIVFDNAYSHVPLTFPSHTTIMTGLLPYVNGVRSNTGYHLDRDPQLTLPRLLSAHGYATGAAVSAYVLRAETGLGSLFDFYDDSMEVWDAENLGNLQRPGDQTVHAALRWLDGVQTRPFFLFLHLFEPHTPYEPVEPFKSRYANPYDGEIATADAIVGRFLTELDRRGLYDKSLIILDSDHGEGLNDHGEAEHGILLYREELHVPLIVKLPGEKMKGRRVTAPAELVDILPTITKAVGATTPAGLPGMSLIDLADGKSRPDRAIYSETMTPRLHLGWSQLRSLTDRTEQYIESPDPELYDIVNDPHERNNVRAERRRDARAFAASLASVPLNLEPQRAANPEEMAKLAALGYLSGPAAQPAGPLRNPRDNIKTIAKIQQTFALDQQQRYEESVALCLEILRDDPGIVDVYMQLAGDLRRLGRLQEALQAYRDAIRISPQLAQSTATEVAKLELDLGNLNAAQQNAELAMKLDPDDAHLVLAAVAQDRNDLPTAEREARLALGPENLPRVPALISLARVLTDEQKLDEALTVIDRAVARVAEGAHPAATLASTRGDILARMGRNQEAEAAFRAEMQNFPQTTDAYVKLALMLASEHRFNEINPTLESRVKASPRPATYFLAAKELNDLGNGAEARAFRMRGERLAREIRTQ